MRSLVAAVMGMLLPACLLKPDPPVSGPGFDELTLGARHACSRSGTAVYCWGDNRSGQLGLPGLGDIVTRATQLDGEWTAISAGAEHTCGISTNGQVLCWGEDADGQVTGATGGRIRMPTPVAISPGATPIFDRVEAGGRHTCALTIDHQLWCWGNETQLGQPSDVAIQIGTRTDWTDLAAGTRHTCGIAGDEVLCWGDNDRGACGRGPAVFPTPTPVAMAGVAGLHPLRVFAGEDTSCAIFGEAGATHGQLWCWGWNLSHIFAAVPTSALDPTQIPGEAWSDVGLSDTRVCGIADGVQYCWGYTTSGGLGDGFWYSEPSVEDRKMIGPADDVELGVPAPFTRTTEFGCQRAGGTISCWGDAPYGELGLFVRTLQPLPVVVPNPNGLKWQDVWTGTAHTCARDDSHFYCWGANGHGQIDGQSTRGDEARCLDGQVCDYTDPQVIPEISTANEVEAIAGDHYTCARTGQDVYCWGWDASRALGTQESGPARREVPGTWRRLFGGPRGSCGIDGTVLKCWGHVATVDVPTPTQVGGIANPTRLSLADNVACATDTSDNRWCWGDRSRGQVGDGQTSGTTTLPTLIEGNTKDVAVGGVHGCKIDGSMGVECWGARDFNANGQETDVSGPTPVMTDAGQLSGCRQLALGDDFSCAACGMDVRCWGTNYDQELGRGETENSSALALPVMLDKRFWKVAVGLDHACALSISEGDLYCWGRDLRGQLGDKGHGTNFPTPILAPAH